MTEGEIASVCKQTIYIEITQGNDLALRRSRGDSEEWAARPSSMYSEKIDAINSSELFECKKGADTDPKLKTS
jgi:hypothetical protein